MPGIAAPLLAGAAVATTGIAVQQPTSLRWPGRDASAAAMEESRGAPPRKLRRPGLLVVEGYRPACFGEGRGYVAGLAQGVVGLAPH